MIMYHFIVHDYIIFSAVANSPNDLLIYFVIAIKILIIHFRF